jgi:predicted GIY-YIG superfamily endonuclease
MKEHKVYHIHYESNPDLMQGYIGVTSDLKQRIRSHRASGMLKKGDTVTTLYVGSREDCYALEEKLRPSDGIGRNKSKGGLINCSSIRPGQRLSPDTEFKKGQHHSKSTEFRKGVTPHNKGKGKDYILTDPEGKEYYVSCISDFCRAHNLTAQNIRKVAKGERNFHKGWKAVQAGR